MGGELSLDSARIKDDSALSRSVPAAPSCPSLLSLCTVFLQSPVPSLSPVSSAQSVSSLQCPVCLQYHFRQQQTAMLQFPSLLALCLLCVAIEVSMATPAVDAADMTEALAMKQKALTAYEMAEKLLQRLLDVALVTAEDAGVPHHQLKELQRKRSVIQACYFQAITCY